jgi:hemerythrin superfamily protein
MNAIDLLKKDHQHVQQLFSEFLSADEEDFGLRWDLFREIEKSLLTHAEAEEQIFYPSIETHSPGTVKRAISEHEEVKELLCELLALEVDDEEFENRITMLIQKVLSHVHDEEDLGGAMDIASQKLSSRELEEMGRKIQQCEKAAEDELAA